MHIACTSAFLIAASLAAFAQTQKKLPTGSEELLIKGPRRSPDKHLLGWREYRSAHFVVDSNLSSFVVARLIQQLETTQALELSALVAEPVPLPGRVRVIAAGASLLGELAPDKYFIGSGKGCQLLNVTCWQLEQQRFDALAGLVNAVNFDPCGQDLFFAGNYFVSRLGEPTIVLPVAGLSVSPEVVAHQVAHHLASHLFLHPPPWLREGFAAFVETIAGETLDNPAPTGSHIQRGERTVVGAVGLAAPGFTAALCRDSVSAKELLRWQGEEAASRPGRYHGHSWLLYHWLWNHRSKKLSDFQSRLASGENAEAAWRQAFPEYNPDHPGALASLDAALDRHRSFGVVGRYYRLKDAAAETDSAYSEAALAPADVHLILIEAQVASQPSNGRARPWLLSELHDLILEEPLQPVALAWRAELGFDSPLDGLRKAVARFPGDWRAWLLLGQAVDAAAEKAAAFRMAVKLKPDSALALQSLALFLATHGEPAEALGYAKQALEVAPWDAQATAVLATIDAFIGECDEALETYQRALRLSFGAGRPEALAQVDRLCRR